VKDESEEIYKEDDVIEEFINSEGEHFYGASPTTTTYQDKEFSMHVMEACLRIHKKRNKTNKTVSEEQEKDYDIAKFFQREEEELGLVTTEVPLDGDDGEIQGTMPKIGEP
jgi:hypothetical protein